MHRSASLAHALPRRGAPDAAAAGPAAPAGDAALVARVLDGDEGALGVLLARHLDAAYAVALAILRDPTDADDACQEAFLIAVRRLDQCAAPERFRHWLLRIVQNRARNLIRRERLREGPSVDAVRAVAPHDVERSAHRAELARDLGRALARLTERQRVIVLLHDVEGLTHAEIADVLGIAAVTSRVNLFKARRNLRRWLAPHQPGAADD
ncbi:sigma-70 family RNA polymerase sigma factor [Roseisolibacter sp. H3M3-2]|uniref:RNA polymerase sigma factor n=1 Tax=Roseisolibacter sp. H3M3-2 TaxID=3031323 RepID=UPI0023DAE5C0|nr:sigma-70 family RNA polymerase sigma factor [Roseisolibacter sp. H3M3-2]MDF1506139.1 sigma-70 family RNA polymerase sigma factor [Roseisolibacter sp. H3M3-2]